MKSVVQRLYDSEINAQISWLWDGRFDVRLGDGLNGWVARDNCDSWAAVETWLTEAACKHYPTSVFAENVRRAALYKAYRFKLSLRFEPVSSEVCDDQGRRVAGRFFRLTAKGPNDEIIGQFLEEDHGWLDHCKTIAEAMETDKPEEICYMMTFKETDAPQPESRFRSQLNPVTQHEPDHSHDSGELPRR